MSDVEDKAKGTWRDIKNRAEQLADKAKAKYYKDKNEKLENRDKSEYIEYGD